MHTQIEGRVAQDLEMLWFQISIFVSEYFLSRLIGPSNVLR